MNPNRLLPTTLMCLLLLAGCAATAPPAAQHAAAPDNAAQGIAMLERVSWGVNGGSVRQLQKEGWSAYLREHGPLLALEDLSQRNCLRFALEDGMHDRWTFYRLPQREQVTVHVSGNRSADDADLVRRWAVAGLGIAYKSRLDVAGDVAAGRLQVLLPEVAGEATPLQLLCMHRAQVTPLVLQLRDFLRDKCAQ